MAFIKNTTATSDMFAHVYGDIHVEAITEKVDALMTANGYKLVPEGTDRRIYEKGNRVMRILFGAFIKYYKISVKIIATAPKEITCEVRSESSGMSGGLIGMDQVKTEIRKLFTTFQSI